MGNYDFALSFACRHNELDHVLTRFAAVTSQPRHKVNRKLLPFRKLRPPKKNWSFPVLSHYLPLHIRRVQLFLAVIGHLEFMTFLQTRMITKAEVARFSSPTESERLRWQVLNSMKT